MGKTFMLRKIFKLLPKGNCLSVLQLGQYVFCITTTYLGNLAFKVFELNQFAYAPNQDRRRRNEMVLWVHEAILTTKPETATCWKKSGAAGFSNDSVSELINLLERTVEHKGNGIIIYVYNLDESALTIF
jgi:hypothetical protein